MKESLYRTIRLLEEAKGPISGEELAERLGVTRAAVWKQIQELREQGYDIASSQKEGYTLRHPSGRLLPYEIKKHLKTRAIGQKMHYLPTIPSTIDVARRFASEGDPEELHGTIVIAEEQTGGVGRLGRAWVSPEGGIWITIILKPSIPIDHVFMITMAGAVAIARAIRREFDLGAMIKWPNDIYIGDKKVAGLLLELSADADTIHYCLLGIGVDVNFDPSVLSPNLQKSVTTIRAELDHEVDRARFLARVLREFERHFDLLEAQEYDAIVREWKSMSCTLDHHVRITTLKRSFEGEAIDIDEYGALIIRKENGKIERVIAGDCIHQ
ncbi:MAG TPA: biotin--[acetyl-CoA-carboxylase] ligase [Methanoregulaceae archaeon]|nr:biotin--[acetyl-CoA-carboxylase] ligase [Methanoregulaceae archaeon]HQJ87938.1 biotin--[acetyl-CoA-carboxylase] ligase [Methanoregulaceae archaeon]